MHVLPAVVELRRRQGRLPFDVGDDLDTLCLCCIGHCGLGLRRRSEKGYTTRVFET